MLASPYRLKRGARFIRDIGYVFIDVDGRLFRLEADRFDAMCEACLRGLTAEERVELAALVEPCDSRATAEQSFLDQEFGAV